MHLEQRGFPQTQHLAMVGTPKCLGHVSASCSGNTAEVPRACRLSSAERASERPGDLPTNRTRVSPGSGASAATSERSASCSIVLLVGEVAVTGTSAPCP